MTTVEAPQIRQATIADLPAVLELLAQPEMDDGEVLELPAAETIFTRMSAYPGYRMLVAERAGRVVGSYVLLIMDNIGHMGAPSAIVEQVLVAPDSHGTGVGRAMMHDAADRARAARCYKLALSSNLIREKAHAFYDSLGFERHGYSFKLDLRP